MFDQSWKVQSVIVVVVREVVKELSFHGVAVVDGCFDPVHCFVVELCVYACHGVLVVFMEGNGLIEGVSPITILRVARSFAS